MNTKLFTIFRRGSKTYFYSSWFFPSGVRDDVFALYGFVRVADDYVDNLPQKREEFEMFNLKFEKAWGGDVSGNEVVDGFVAMAKRVGIQKDWVEAFLAAMKSDIGARKQVKNRKELLVYMYGSAEVIGLMMAKIMRLSDTAMASAAMLGRAMQMVNFIRDVAEDIKLGRTYLPGLPERKSPEHDAFIREQIQTYLEWQGEAEQGFKYLPKRYRVAVKTASDMYRWTAKQIAKNPQVIYERKVKPSIVRIVLAGMRNWLFCRW